MAELPYMKLWVQRLKGSARVRAMPGLSRLIYLGLLTEEWAFQGRGLPADTATMARLLDIDQRVFEGAWTGSNAIEQFFELRDGRYFNETLEEIYSQEISKQRKRSRNGKVAMAKRWGGLKCDSNAIAPLQQRYSEAITSRDGGGDGDDVLLHPDGGGCGGGAETGGAPEVEGEGKVASDVDPIREVVDWAVTHLVMNHHEALDAVRTHGTTPDDLPAWQEALRGAQGLPRLRNARAYLRKYFARFRHPPADMLNEAEAPGTIRSSLNPKGKFSDDRFR